MCVGERDREKEIERLGGKLKTAWKALLLKIFLAG